MVRRVAVFIDYQNVYRRAQDAFGFHSHWEGQIHPFALGYELAVTRSPAGDDRERQLSEVRIYRGLPDARRDPTGNAACARQLAFWAGLPKVVPWKRPLQYPRHGGPPREKGVDVKLAIDLTMGAVQREYDCAVVFSADTDLVPAIDAVLDLLGSDSVEVASWKADRGRTSSLRATSGPLWCHWLDRRTYDHVADLHDYNTGQNPRHSTPA